MDCTPDKERQRELNLHCESTGYSLMLSESGEQGHIVTLAGELGMASSVINNNLHEEKGMT